MIALFISLAILLVLVILFLIFYPKFYKAKLKKDFVPIYGKKIYRYALHNDLYLINQLELKGNDDQIIKIDHLLFANKFIYVISDYYLPGLVLAKENDQSFIYKSSEKDSQNVYIDNLLIKGKELANKVAFNLGLNPSLFISVALVNDASDFDNFKSTSLDTFIVHLSSFNKFIDKIESRNVAPLNNDQLKYTVKDINRLNERRKTKKH